MKRLQVLSVILLTVFFSYTVIAQEMGSLKGGYEISFPEKIQKLVLDPLPAGTYSVGTGGDFPTIDSAFNKLSIDGIAGEVIIELIDDVYTAPSVQYGFVLNGPIPGAGPNSRVTIKPAANHNVTIQGNNLGLLILINTSYVTFDGVGVTGSTTLTINALQNTSYVYNDALDFNNNSDHNKIQNITFIVDDYLRPSAGIWFSGSAPDSNFIQYNVVKKAGIFLSITTGGNGNIIRGNKIGSETDSLVAYGIEVVDCEGTLIENNLIQNMNVTVSGSNQAQVGIALDGGNNQIIRNNVIRNCRSISGYVTAGIYAGVGGTNNQIYNNMVYGIHSTSIQSNSRLAGIYIAYQTNPKIYYNSVYLLGSGATPLGSAAFYIYTNSTNVDAKNNIFINTRDESPYYASAIYDYSASNLTSDYNDLYSNNYLVRIGSTNYNTLADWQATGKDLNSIFEMPNFIDPYLHIDETLPTNLESGATPIAGIIVDFDGDIRSATTPDIGADEFDGFTPVELTSFTATTNGNEIILNWSTATELNNQGFEIERSEDNVSFNKIGFVPGFGTTTESKSYSCSDQPASSGTFYYRLKQVDYDGSFEYSEVIEVELEALNSYFLEQNFPNPFNPTTKINWQLPEPGNITLKIINALGEEIATLLNEFQPAGKYATEFNAANLPSGVYFYQLKAGNYADTKKMILLK